MMLRAGAAEVVITPPVGTPLEGYGARTEPSIGVHDDLTAQALVLDDGRTRVGLLTCDLIGVDRPLTTWVRREVEQRGLLPGDHLLIAATHTHGGPRGLLALRGEADETLVTITARQLVGVVSAATREMRPARLMLGWSAVESVSQNRRFPHGPIDPTLFVLRVEEAQTGRLLATLVNFAMHPTVMNFDNLFITADYPGRVRQVIRRVLGEEVIVLFANGACGNINPARVAAVFSEVERIGTIIGAAAVRLLAELTALGQLVAADNLLWGERTPKPPPEATVAITAPDLRVARAEIELPLRSFASAASYDAQIAQLRQALDSLVLQFPLYFFRGMLGVGGDACGARHLWV